MSSEFMHRGRGRCSRAGAALVRRPRPTRLAGSAASTTVEYTNASEDRPLRGRQYSSVVISSRSPASRIGSLDVGDQGGAGPTAPVPRCTGTTETTSRCSRVANATWSQHVAAVETVVHRGRPHRSSSRRSLATNGTDRSHRIWKLRKTGSEASGSSPGHVRARCAGMRLREARL